MLENLFINILEISITSAAAIAVILLISGLSENKFRKKQAKMKIACIGEIYGNDDDAKNSRGARGIR